MQQLVAPLPDLRPGYVASFIGRAPGTALFVGLYEIGASTPFTFEEYWQVKANTELQDCGAEGFTKEKAACRGNGSILWFDLTLTEYYAEWKGKLVIGFPSGRRWWRRTSEEHNIMRSDERRTTP